MAVCYVTSLAIVMLNLAPELERQMRSELAYEPWQVGVFFIVELGALGVASIPFRRVRARMEIERLGNVVTALWVAANAMSALVLSSFAGVLATRFVAGLAAGTLMVLGMKTAAAARIPDRAFAAMVCAQLASGAMLLAVIPTLMASGLGLKAVFVVNVLLAIPVPWLVRSLDVTHPIAAQADRGARTGGIPLRPSAVLLVLAAVVFNATIGGLWTFIGEFARSPSKLPSVLSLATLAGIVATLLAGAIGHRGSRVAWLVCGQLGIALGTILASLSVHDAGFALGCLLVSLAWNFSVPLLLSMCADRARGVDLMPSMNLAFAFGLAVGPSAAGLAFERTGSDGLVAIVLIGLGLTVAFLILADAVDRHGR
ncbi:MAG: MFS transporter [Burkholderiales bacterium]